MSKSQRKYTKNFVQDNCYEDGSPIRQKSKPDKRKERRIERALKTRNVHEYMHLEDDEI